jgi:hypothetical protein
MGDYCQNKLEAMTAWLAKNAGPAASAALAAPARTALPARTGESQSA